MARDFTRISSPRACWASINEYGIVIVVSRVSLYPIPNASDLIIRDGWYGWDQPKVWFRVHRLFNKKGDPLFADRPIIQSFTGSY
jgi:hypothetical protein